MRNKYLGSHVGSCGGHIRPDAHPFEAAEDLIREDCRPGKGQEVQANDDERDGNSHRPVQASHPSGDCREAPAARTVASGQRDARCPEVYCGRRTPTEPASWHRLQTRADTTLGRRLPRVTLDRAMKDRTLAEQILKLAKRYRDQASELLQIDLFD